MNLHKTISSLTIAVFSLLPLALVAGCTGPPSGTAGGGAANNTNTSQAMGLEAPPQSDDYSNTTN